MTATTEATDLEALARGIEEDVLAAIGRKIERRRQENLSAFDLDDPCERYGAYTITHWQDRMLPTAEKQALFDLSGFLTQFSEGLFRAADYQGERYRVEAQEVNWEVRTRSGRPITGHIDFWLTGGRLGSQRVPIEHKALSYGQEEGWSSWRDMLSAKARWVRRYPGQLNTYLLQAGAPFGFFAVLGKERALPTLFPMELDYEFAERLMQRAEDIYLHFECGELPERIPYSAELCPGCDFAHICCPEKAIEVAEAGLVLDDEREQEAARYFELEPLAKEYEKLKKSLSGWAKGAASGTGLTEFVLGPAAVSVAYRTRKAYSVAESAYAQVTIKRREQP